MAEIKLSSWSHQHEKPHIHRWIGLDGRWWIPSTRSQWSLWGINFIIIATYLGRSRWWWWWWRSSDAATHLVSRRRWGRTACTCVFAFGPLRDSEKVEGKVERAKNWEYHPKTQSVGKTKKRGGNTNQPSNTRGKSAFPWNLSSPSRTDEIYYRHPSIPPCSCGAKKSRSHFWWKLSVDSVGNPLVPRGLTVTILTR